MNTPDVPSSAHSPVRRVAIGTAKTVGVLAGVAAVLWLLVAAVRLIVAYHVVALLALAVLGLMIAAWGVVREARKRKAAILEERIRDRARWELVDAMSGTDFEDLVADLLRRDGFRDVRRVGRSHDGGVDVVARAADGRWIAVQCKRQAARVGADRVRNLIGAVNGSTYGGHRAVLVTSSVFTTPAGREAEGHVLLVDRHHLGEWMKGASLKI
ncbi:restriction endonuclease [Sphaerisporangium sp. NPDC051017]|uniref:restriction endonuclease n=1 Tax=Sphaerisporangium sp. NPDC051017 TaxID=3154636 RepID=UPI0034367341